MVSELWMRIDSLPANARNESCLPSLLHAELSKLPVPRLIRFQTELLDGISQLLTWRLWEAADLVHPVECSGDAFAEFRLWVVAQGSETFASIVNDPDSLASLPEIGRLAMLPEPWADADYPHLASLGNVACEAFDALLAKLRPEVARTVQRPSVFDTPVARGKIEGGLG